MAKILGCKVAALPMNYLGMPLGSSILEEMESRVSVSNFTQLTSSSIISSIFSSFNYCGIVAADENVKHSSDVVYSLMTVRGSNCNPDYHGRVHLLRKVLTRGDRKP